MKEMRQLTKDPNAAAKARAAEERANEEAGLSKPLAIPLNATSTTKKKPVFKLLSTNQTVDLSTSSTPKPVEQSKAPLPPGESAVETTSSVDVQDPNAAIANGWANQAYDQTQPKTSSQHRQLVITEDGFRWADELTDDITYHAIGSKQPSDSVRG